MESSSFSSLPQNNPITPPETSPRVTAPVDQLEQQVKTVQAKLTKLLQEDIQVLEDRKKNLQIAVDQLERRQERIQAEMGKTFAGTSQELAVRVQGFKDYLVNSLQDLAATAEQLALLPETPRSKPQPAAVVIEPEVTVTRRPEPEPRAASAPVQPQFAVQGFQEEQRQINKLLDQYRTAPNYYGPPWQLRRTFEPVHAERVLRWFLDLGGRGAIRSVGTRLQNVLVASAVISVLTHLYGSQVKTLILADSPERLGDWRRGLQDCLGITRTDFGPDRGIGLFESPEALVQKADRLEKDGDLPLILLDDSEEMVSLSILQFPLWLAFAPDPKQQRDRQSVDWFA